MNEQPSKKELSSIETLIGMMLMFSAAIFYLYGVAWVAIETSRIIGDSIILAMLSLAILLSILLNHSTFNTIMKKFLSVTTMYFLLVFAVQLF